MTNTVQIDIIANDLVSPIINGITGKFGAIDFALGGVRAGFGLLTGDILAASQGIQDMVGGIKQIGSELAQAAQAQTKFISDANNLAVGSGLSLGQTEGLMDDINQSLAKNAAELPGTTSDYVKLANQISSTFALNKNLFDPEVAKRFKSELVDVATQYTLIGQTVPNLTAEMSGDFLRRLLAGKESWGSLKVLQFAQSNPGFENAFRQELGSIGKNVTDWTKLGDDTRFNIVQAVGKKIANKDYINRLQGTADAQMESIRSSLFDDLVGTFGFRRKIASADGRSVLDSFTDFLKGWTYFGQQIGAITRKLGLTFDPLKPIVDAIDWLTSLGNRSGYLLDLGGGVQALAKGMVDGINSAIQGWLKAVASFDTRSLGKWFGDSVNGYFKTAIGFLWTIDYSNLGKLLGIGLVKVISVVTQGMLRFNWLLIPQYLATGILAVCKLLVGLAFGVVEGVIRELPSLFSAWWQKIVDSFVGFFRGLYDGLTAIKDTVYGWVEQVKTLLPNLPGVMTQAIPQPVKDGLEKLDKVTPEPVKQVAKATVDIGLGAFIPGWNFLEGSRGLTPPQSATVQPNLMPPNTRPLEIPKTPGTEQKQATGVFNPTIHNHFNNQADPQHLARLVSDQIASDYNRYVQGQLA